MGFKKERLGPRLTAAARSGERNRDAHVFLGGTGAVGGTALLQMLSLYEEMFAISAPAPDDVPVLVATGTSSDEIRAFTRRLHRFIESRHGPGLMPERIRSGYLTHSGVFVSLERFAVTAVPGLRLIGQTPPEHRRDQVVRFLEEIGTGPDDPEGTVVKALAETISTTRPFTRFLEQYRSGHLESLGVERFRSVTVGIPVPSLVAYHLDDVHALATHVEALTPDGVEELKGRFVEAIRDDLVEVQQRLADTVLVAHTTGVGGMYDESLEDPGGRPTTRLAFAHAGRDLWVGEKTKFAQDLTRLYAAAGIKVLVTAAAIGIDEVRVRERVPLHRQIRRRLFESEVEVFPGSKGARPDAGEEREHPAPGHGGRNGRGPRSPAQHVIRVFRPLTVPWDAPPSGPVRFDRGSPIVPSYAIRSGENGFFTVANADALYRVMRVASASELGLMLATVGLLGEDRLSPWFPDNVCYFGQTDNARQVLDFLSQPALFACQLSGLEPMALQDLGSAKHQAELHTLSLLILLHRLRKLDVDAIDPYTHLASFDPRAFLLERSRALSFEDVVGWDFAELARDLSVLASADRPEDLLSLTPPRDYALFPRKKDALTRVLERVLAAVWAIPSLGSPILFQGTDGLARLRTGYYVAPLDLLVTAGDSVATWFRRAHEEKRSAAPIEDLRDYHLSVGGFVDLRPHAIVCTARHDDEDLRGRVARFTDEAALREHLRAVEPYSFFSTCGLLAVVYRLRSLYGLLREAMIELGTLQEWRWHMPRGAGGQVLVAPGVVEALRMVSEGMEKTTGTERLDGIWGYERRPVPDRRGTIPGLS